MKRLKALLIGCVAALGAATLLTGCSFSLPETSYTPPEKTPVVSSPTVMTDGVLTVGVNASNAPLAGQPANSSKIVGIDVDMAAALADYLGLKLNVVDVGTDPASALANGKVDIVMGVNNSGNNTGIWVSESYLPTGVALFAPASVASAPDAKTTDNIAAQLSSKSAWAVANAYKSAKIVTTDKLEEAFASLASGGVQYVASDLVIGTYAAHASESDAHVVALLQAASGYCVGISNTNSELKQYISEALDSLMNGGVVKVIQTKWLGAPVDLTSIKVVEATAAADDKDAEDGEDADDKKDEGANSSSANSATTQSAGSAAAPR